MSAPTPEPGPLTRRALELKAQQDQLNAFVNQAFQTASQSPTAAEPMLTESLRLTEEFFRAQEEFLHQLPGGEQQIPALRESARNERVMILGMLALTARVTGRSNDARARCQESLALLDADSAMRPSLQLSLASLDMQRPGPVSGAQYDSTAATLEDACRGLERLEQWPAAVEARSLIATWAIQNNRRPTYFTEIDRAIQLADAHELFQVSARLRAQKLQYALLTDTSGKSPDELKKQLPQLLSSVAESLSLDAQRCLLLDDPDTAGEYFTSAARIAEALPPQSRWLIELDYAGYLERQSKFDEALAHAEQALRLARRLQSRDIINRALTAAIPLRARFDDPTQATRATSELAELASAGDPASYTQALLLRSQALLAQHHPEQALADTDPALAANPPADLRRLTLMLRATLLEELNHPQEAFDAATAALRLLDESSPASSALAGAPERQAAESLHILTAWLASRLHHLPAEIFSLLESGRARDLQRELARLGPTGGQPPLVPYDQLRAQLAEDSAALLTFGIMRWGTLAILAEPSSPQPTVFPIALPARELSQLLSRPGLAEDSRLWTDVIYSALPQLSAALLHPLARTLDSLTSSVETLYIAADSFLYRVPFAALTFPGDRPTYLAERFALASIPSASAYSSLRALRRPPSRECLAYGLGESNGLFFAAQARAVASLAWTRSKLLDERTHPAELLAEAAKYPVLHLACHGGLSSSVYDTLRASQLEMFPPEFLTAAQVYSADPPLDADLVFLNACQSGRFRMRTRGEPDGFWRAFLKAGARSVLATLTHVDPAAANSLALAFYQHWLSGASKAAALQSAQLEALRAGLPPQHWASHVLLGDAA